MAEQPDTLSVLTRVASEMEASLVVLRLVDSGIAATAVGGFTAGIPTEGAHDSIVVMVKSADLPAAEAALAAIEDEPSLGQAAGGEVNAGCEEESAEDETAARTEPGATRPFWGAMAVTVLFLSLLALAALPHRLAAAAIAAVWLLFLGHQLWKSAPRE